MQSENRHTKKYAITVRFSDEHLLNEIRQLAIDEHRSVSGQIEHMLSLLVAMKREMHIRSLENYTATSGEKE